MNTTKMKLTLVGICGVLLAPMATEAAGATLVAENTVLFTIDFAFADDSFNVEVPIVAERGVTYTDRVDTVGYEITTSDGTAIAAESVSGLVLSRQTINGNRYSVNEDEIGQFRLMILATFAEPVTDTVVAEITKMPYWIDGQRTTVHQNQLDEFMMPRLEAG